VLAAAVATLGLAACGGSSSPATGSSSNANAGPIQRGGTLTIAIGDDYEGGGNLQASGAVDDYILNSTALDPLFDVGKNGKPVPALALKGTPSNGDLTWTLTLRQGVKFTDGNPFNANAVAANLAMLTKPTSSVSVNLTNLESWKVTGQYTIALQLKTPDANLPYTFMNQLYMQEMNPYNANDPIGTGPYEYVSRIVGNSLTFKRNPDYWRGTPPLDKVIFKVVTNPEVATLDLEQGVVDMIAPTLLDGTSITSLRSQSGITLSKATGSDNNQALMNYQKDRDGKYKNGQDVREGLADLMDTAKIVPPLVGGVGTLATQVIPPGEAGYDSSIKVRPYDQAKGEALLAAGGIPKGGTINILALDEGPLCPVATAYQSTLDSLGYKAKLACDAHAVAIKALLNYDSWDVAFWHSGENNLASSAFEDMWDIGKVPNPPNFIFTYRNPSLQKLILQMQATDPTQAAYQSAADQAAQLILNQAVAAVPLFWNVVYVASNSKVHGLIANTQGLHYGQLMNAISTVWLSK
jgi:ABC-type transport system substrate-binding protein